MLPALLEPIAPESEVQLLQTLFPEAGIETARASRRVFQRDNTARLRPRFLDPHQEWASKLDLEPLHEQGQMARDFSLRLINGVAGSGKTLIAASRARLLAQMFPEQRVLMLIHNTPVVADLLHRLRQAWQGLPDNLEIMTFAAWARRQWIRLRGHAPGGMVDGRELPALLQRLGGTEQKPSPAQLAEEIDFLNEYLIDSLDAYQAVNRAGRGFALRADERASVWQLFERLRAHLAKTGQHLWSDLPRDICQADYLTKLERHDHILVDEAQFFAPSWFKAVSLALRPEGSLFLCADPSQGFLKRKLSWKSSGLEVQGRTRKLRRSYRTTRSLLDAASQLLAQAGQANPEDFLTPDYVGMDEGMPPILIQTASPQDAVDRLVNEVADLVGAGLAHLDDFLVIYGDNINKSLLYNQLCRRWREDAIWWLNKEDQKKSPPGDAHSPHLRLANLDTATGLEAPIVLLIGMEKLFSDALPPDSRESPAIEQEELARKRYMAMTRAAERLSVFSSAPMAAVYTDAFA